MENAKLTNGVCACIDGFTASSDRSMCESAAKDVEGRTASTKETFIVATSLGLFMALVVGVLVVLTIIFKRRSVRK